MLNSNLLKFIEKVNAMPNNHQRTLQEHLLHILKTSDRIKMYNVLIYIDSELKSQINEITKSDNVDLKKHSFYVSKINKIIAFIGMDLSREAVSFTSRVTLDDLMILDDILVGTNEVKKENLTDYKNLIDEIKQNLNTIEDEKSKKIAQHILSEFNDALLLYEIGGQKAFYQALENNICKFDFIIKDESVDETVRENFTRLGDLILEMVDSAARGNFLAQGTTLLLN